MMVRKAIMELLVNGYEDVPEKRNLDVGMECVLASKEGSLESLGI